MILKIQMQCFIYSFILLLLFVYLYILLIITYYFFFFPSVFLFTLTFYIITYFCFFFCTDQTLFQGITNGASASAVRNEYGEKIIIMICCWRCIEPVYSFYFVVFVFSALIKINFALVASFVFSYVCLCVLLYWTKKIIILYNYYF